MEQLSLQEFNTRLASSAPTPGGGGVSALAAALGAGLGRMVGSLTVGKKQYAANEEELLTLMSEAKELQDRALALVNQDAEEFQKLMAAYALPKDAIDRTERIEAALISAAGAPMEVVRLCEREAELTERFARLGSSLMLSDAGCAAALCASAMKAAALNVCANTKLMRDRSAADEMNCKVKEALEKTIPLTEEIYNSVAEKLMMGN